MRAGGNDKGRGGVIVPIPNNWCVFLNYSIVINTNYTTFCRHNNMTRRGSPLPITILTWPGGEFLLVASNTRFNMARREKPFSSR